MGKIVGHDNKNYSLKTLAIIVMCVIYITHFFLQIDQLEWIIFVLAVFIFGSSIIHLRGIPKYTGIILTASGLSIIVYTGQGIQELMDGFIVNLPLLILILLVPLISMPLKTSGHFKAVQDMMKKWLGDAKKTFITLTSILFFLSPVLNLGTIRIVHDMVSKLRIHPAILAKSYMIGFSSIVLWSPYFAAVLLPTYYLNISVVSYFPYGFGLSLVQFSVGMFIFFLWIKTSKLTVTTDLEIGSAPFNKHLYVRIIQLVFLLISLIAVILLLEAWTGWPITMLVTIISISFPIVWGVFKRNWGQMKEDFSQHLHSITHSMNNEIVLFLGAGLFGSALSSTVLTEWIRIFLIDVSSYSFIVFILVIMFTVAILAFVGVHQIIVVPILAMQMNPEMIGTSPIVLVLTLVFAWSFSTLLSPLNALNLMISSLLSRSPLIVGVRWNGLFAFVMLAIGITCIYVVHRFLM
jgi:hypothetical protein